MNSDSLRFSLVASLALISRWRVTTRATSGQAPVKRLDHEPWMAIERQLASINESGFTAHVQQVNPD